MALISDGYDALSDTFSSFFVWMGIKFNYERFTNLLVIVMILAAGIISLYESSNKLYNVIFATVAPIINIDLVIVIELINILTTLFLFIYQRHIGKFNNNLTLISQSVDSKNHILTCLVIIIGTLFSSVNILWIDPIIGIFIGFRILRDSIDLSKEFKKELGNEKVDYGKYKTFFGDYMNLNHNENFAIWVLYKSKNKFVDKNELITSFKILEKEEYCPLISEMGIVFDYDIDYEEVFQKLLNLKFVVCENDSFKITKKGTNSLIKMLKSFSRYNVNIFDYFILKISNE